MAYLYSIAGGRAEAQGGRHGSGKNRRCLHCAISAGWLGRHEVRKLRDASHRAEMQGRDEKGSPSHTHSRHARTHAYDSSPPSHDSSYCLTHALLARMHARTPRYICTPAHAPTHVHATTCRHTHTPTPTPTFTPLLSGSCVKQRRKQSWQSSHRSLTVSTTSRI